MIKLENVNRSFGDRHVLKDINFEVASGRMTGFVGANGAGKTTTMRIILGVLAADSGTVQINGSELTQKSRARFGYMPEERGLYPKMKVLEQLVYLARLHGLTAADAKASATALIERLGLTERANDALESLSLGNQQRAQIAAALVHKPIALVLDEPFSGLDPMAVETVLSVLRDYASEGAPVLFSSHQLDIVERLCDDIVLISEGEIRASGSRESLSAAHGGNRFTIEAPGATDWLRGFAGVQGVAQQGSTIYFEADSETANRVLAEAVRRGPVVQFAPHRPSLAQIFKEIVE